MGSIDRRTMAVLDVGSNTIRLLVARMYDGRLEKILDQSEFVRLGLGVDATGNLQPDRQDAAVEAIRRLQARAHAEGAEEIVAIATSAVRDAANGGSFIQRVQADTGVPLEIISGRREADLTYLGATTGLDLQGGALICDLGGGSTELICVDETGIKWATSEQIGSGRLTERIVHHDPPEQSELSAVSTFVSHVLDRLPEARVSLVAFTGGTATHAALMAGATGAVERMEMATLDRVASIAGSHPASEIAARYQFRLERARVLPAGITTLLAIALFYGVNSVVVTRNGLREGALIDRFRQKGEDT